ncbi:hypothetical protein SPOG_02556 [Schizosaccharomyces cryophilus OY26]|uniref:Uncharacterized protein n=1 Tax=Schizosaccharomyces cryophilus (strain OY26 / ATCC MYA-4695 / CBS 11777 / NBRC 106824 / NRRL Y48691) TaxID=653667 RepID=S9VUD2_SCHCR|nr:uncharacterized protein SPOG_02556 [Schizosaccharomyces cryophilus OY26]EPY51383.1 hypothetical protein SPOG_02556 [Schizosaccharomyces cryophilus OY26]
MEKADEFVRLNPELKDKIEFVIVKDISESYALKDVIKDCDYVCQFASPVSVYVADYKTQILDPAVNGILSFLEAAATEPKVKRVIIISTSAATVNFTADPNAGYTYNEKDWNPVSYEEAMQPSMQSNQVDVRDVANAYVFALKNQQPRSVLREKFPEKKDVISEPSNVPFNEKLYKWDNSLSISRFRILQ